MRVITANHAPDHTTIARFRQRHEGALGALFGGVLVLCAEAGLVGADVVAIDGTKVHASAARDARLRADRARDPRTGRGDRRAEDEQFGERRGDELPPELSTPEGRQRWLRDARRRLDDRRAEEARSVPRSRAKRLLEAQRRLEQNLDVERRANADYEAYRARGVMKDGRRFGRPPRPYRPPDTPAGEINLTDPDSRNVKTPRGWVRGYNAQAATNERRIMIAAEVTIDSPDCGHLEPMVTATETELAAAGVNESPEVVLADDGYWHQTQMERIVSRGTVVLVPRDAGKRKARPGWDGGVYAFMRRVLATDHGGELYRKRKGMIEPVFGHTKFNRRIDRFQRRGRSAAPSEWRLITATHNLLKLNRHQIAAAAA